MEEAEEEVQQVPEEVPKSPEKTPKTPEKVEKKRAKVIEAPIAEEVPQEAPQEPPEEPPKEAPKRTGRPVGAKDSKPRKKKEPEEVVVERRLVDPVYSYHEAKRQAVERAYQAQGEHWSNLLAHLM